MKTIKQISVLVLACMLTSMSWAQEKSTDNKSLYKAFEMSVSEGLNLQATAKVGIKPVYGLFSIGIPIFERELQMGVWRWSWYPFGAE